MMPISTQIEELGGHVFRSKMPHEAVLTGSQKLLEVEGRYYHNVQGDEPNQDTKALTDLVALLSGCFVQIATAHVQVNAADAGYPNIVKVVTDHSTIALYFSRARIPLIGMAWPILTIGNILASMGIEGSPVGIHWNSRKAHWNR